MKKNEIIAELKVARLIPSWMAKGYTKECKCGQHINYLSKICPYCKEEHA